MEKNEIKCPKCGSMARIVGASNSTCVYYPEVYNEKGELVDTGHNTTTTEQTCLKCGHKYYTVNGKVTK